MRRTKYRFLHQANGVYYWESVSYVDSRVEQISCPVEWFWNSRPSSD